MPYDSIIDRSGNEALVPPETSAEIIQALPGSNPIMQLARRLPNLATGQRNMPMFGSSPYAYFVTSGGLKQTTDADWTNVYLNAEEIAVIVPIPQDVLDDSNYDIWGELRPQLVAAFGRTIFGAVAYGTAIPSSWTTNFGGHAGIVALAAAHSSSVSLAGFSDLYEAIAGESADGQADGLLMKLEADGYICTGHVGHASLRGKLRNCRDMNGQPIFTRSMQDATRYELDGAPIYFPTDGSVSSTYYDIAGQWDQLVYAMRQDITYQIFTEGVISDAQGAVVLNLMQQDSVALRAVMRIAFALPNPVNPVQPTTGSRSPFAYLTA
jgi:HK97 family phage major capsid protein